MGEDFFLITMILSLTVVAPIWLTFHYVTRWRSTKTLTGEDEKMLQTLWDSASKMEARIISLDRILDAEAPGRRGQHRDVS